MAVPDRRRAGLRRRAARHVDRAGRAAGHPGPGGGVGGLTDQIKNKLGLAVLTLQKNEDTTTNTEKTNDILENTSLVLGKYLSPRLYVHYSIGLLDPVNKFIVQYKLKKNLIIQTETSSQGNGGDLLYSIEH